MHSFALRLWIALGWTLFTTTAFADTRELGAIKRSVDSRITYQYYTGKDWRYIRPTQEGTGNCAVFAYTYWRELINNGYKAHIDVCKTPDGVDHVFAVVNGYVLDNRERWVVKQGENCK